MQGRNSLEGLSVLRTTVLVVIFVMSDELLGKRLVILGLARQGKALARFAAEAGARVVASDLRPAEQLGSELDELSAISVTVILGEHSLSLLDDADILAISGGVPTDIPIVKEALSRGIPVTNDSHEFIKRCPAKIVGITGSAGKTTTTALTGAMARLSGRNTWVGGNIGQPLLASLPEMHSQDIVVQELSSFQLELWTQSPHVAAVLNVTPNHLDRHKTMAAYTAAKANILRFQAPDDVAVLSEDNPGSKALQNLAPGILRFFSLELPVEDGAFVREREIWLRDGNRETAVCALDDIPLRGRHNVSNVLAAVVLADSAGVPAEEFREAIKAFPGVEHRLEPVGTVEGVQYVNDSIATAPERAMAALQAFDEPIILLAGGRDKDMVWDEWARQVHKRVKAVVLFGELAGVLKTHLIVAAKQRTSGLSITSVTTMEEAVAAATTLARPGDIVLLSPGGTSFDVYTDFSARGEAFREIVLSMHGKAKRSL
jgi:UDP-N-acetylmuramoylalanine--D-glutamate ligase